MNELTTKDRIAYAVGGGFASNLGFYAMLVFFITYASDIYGIDPVTVGVITLISRLIDTVTDPLMGAIGDRTKSKLGKYRFWVTYTAPFVGISTFFIFASPELSATLKVAYMYVAYILYTIISTAANIPYHSLTAYLTGNVKERTNIVLIKQFTGLLTQFVVSAGGIFILTHFSQTTSLDGSAVIDVTSYRYLGAFFGVLITLGFWVCAYGSRKNDTLERIQSDEKANSETQSSDSTSIVDIFKQMLVAFKSISLGCLALASSANTLTLAMTSGVTVQFYTYVMSDAELAAQGALFNVCFGATAYLLVKWAVNHFGNKKAFVFICSLALIPSFILFATFDDSNVTYTVVMLALIMSLAQAGSLVTWMMVTDCADELKWKTKQNAAGVASSTLTFSNKFGSAIGAFLLGWVLNYIGYVPGAAEQGVDTISGLVFLMVVTPALGQLIALFSMIFYPLNKENHKQICMNLLGADK
ncbi:MFS transporter [Vibrio navarrensis]|uniref:MFS transporter n=1 Tax=Vibrio navarrensis TaxID=29495 RepID=A0AAI9G712_9VIBR|nr:MFS transporter [Vibrio navarrensis]